MRDDFPARIKEVLAKRVGQRCSNPDCRRATSGPHEDLSRAVNVGVASHIAAAAAGDLSTIALFRPCSARKSRMEFGYARSVQSSSALTLHGTRLRFFTTGSARPNSKQIWNLPAAERRITYLSLLSHSTHSSPRWPASHITMQGRGFCRQDGNQGCDIGLTAAIQMSRQATALNSGSRDTGR